LAVALGDVAAVLDRRDDRRVRARPTDAVLLERLHERRLRVTGGRLREVLRGDELRERERLSVLQRGEALLVVLGGGLHDSEGAVEEHLLALRDERPAAARDVHGGEAVARGRHLARDEAVPDERVEPQLVAGEVALDRIGRARGGRRADRLVRFL